MDYPWIIHGYPMIIHGYPWMIQRAVISFGWHRTELASVLFWTKNLKIMLNRVFLEFSKKTYLVGPRISNTHHKDIDVDFQSRRDEHKHQHDIHIICLRMRLSLTPETCINTPTTFGTDVIIKSSDSLQVLLGRYRK